MNILDTVGISLHCHSCGSNYRVPLRDVLLSHTILHEGCPVRQETECPPVFQSRLFERKDIEELERTWSRLEQQARTDGGELVLMATDVSDTPPRPDDALPSLGRPSPASLSATFTSGTAQRSVSPSNPKEPERPKLTSGHIRRRKQGKNRRLPDGQRFEGDTT
jgi:hypothetical protein